MGRVSIVSGGEGGLYSVKRVIQTIDVSSLNSEKSVLEAEMSSVQSRVDSLYAIWQSAISTLSTMISSGEAQDSILAQEKIVIDAEIAHNLAVTALSTIRISIFNIEKQIKSAEKTANPNPETVWCADFTEDLSGEVDSIEIDGDIRRIYIAPGGTDPISGLSGVKEQPLNAMSAAQAFYNLATFPGWQRWMPTYRTAIIERMEYDETVGWGMDFRLDRNPSHAQGLNINPDESALEPTTVGVEYMGCDHFVFQPGDHVIVAFPDRNWDTATVVGFAGNPRQCEPKTHVLVRFGTIAMAYCVEEDQVIMPPTQEGSDAWTEWYSRLSEVVEYDSPYSSDLDIVPDILEDWPNFYDDTRSGEGMADNVTICGMGSCFYAYKNGFEQELVGDCPEDPEPDRPNDYERAARWAWDYVNVDNHVLYWHAEDGWKGGCYPSYDSTFSGPLATVSTKSIIQQQYEYNRYFPCIGDFETRMSWLTEWTVSAFSDVSLSGDCSVTLDYNGKRAVSIDWWGPCIVGLVLTDDVLLQCYQCEHGTFVDGTYSNVSVWVSATCDFAPGEARDLSPAGRTQNVNFANAIAACWSAWRSAYGYAANDPYVPAENPGIYLNVVKYAPDPSKTYPYTIE